MPDAEEHNNTFNCERYGVLGPNHVPIQQQSIGEGHDRVPNYAPLLSKQMDHLELPDHLKEAYERSVKIGSHYNSQMIIDGFDTLRKFFENQA